MKRKVLYAIGAFFLVLVIISLFSGGEESKTAPATAEGKTATEDTVKPDTPEVDPTGKWSPLFTNAYMSGCFNGSNLEYCQCTLDYIIAHNDLEKVLTMTEAEQNDMITPAVLHCAGTL
jgi:hypothetical protein